MSGDPGSLAGLENPQAVAQSRCKLLDRQQLDASRSQLQGQRETVQLLCDPDDRVRVCRGQGEGRLDRHHPLDEQPDRLAAAELLRVRLAPAIGQSQRGNRPGDLTGEAQRFTTGRQNS